MSYSQYGLYFYGKAKDETIVFNKERVNLRIGEMMCALLNKDKAYLNDLVNTAINIQLEGNNYGALLGSVRYIKMQPVKVPVVKLSPGKVPPASIYSPKESFSAYDEERAKKSLSKIRGLILDFFEKQKTETDLLLAKIIFLLPCYKVYHEIKSEVQTYDSGSISDSVKRSLKLVPDAEMDLYYSEYPGEIRHKVNMLSGYEEWISSLINPIYGDVCSLYMTDAVVGTYDMQEYILHKKNRINTERAYTHLLANHIKNVQILWEKLQSAFNSYIPDEIDKLRLNDVERQQAVELLESAFDREMQKVHALYVLPPDMATEIFAVGKKYALQTSYTYSVLSLEELVFVEYSNFKGKREVKRCEYCGRFFVKYQEKNKYCPNCKIKGPMANYEEKQFNNSATGKEYNKKYTSYLAWMKRNEQSITFERGSMFARYVVDIADTRSQITVEAKECIEKECEDTIRQEIKTRYGKWKEAADAAKQELFCGTISEDEFKKRIELPPIEERCPTLAKIRKQYRS